MRTTLCLTLTLWAVTPLFGAAGQLRVHLPPDATLKINNLVSQQTDGVRVIRSQDLEPGRDYYYDLEASAVRNGVPFTEKRTTSIRAGEETIIRFYFPAQQTTGAATPGGYRPLYGSALYGSAQQSVVDPYNRPPFPLYQGPTPPGLPSGGGNVLQPGSPVPTGLFSGGGNPSRTSENIDKSSAPPPPGTTPEPNAETIRARP